MIKGEIKTVPVIQVMELDDELQTYFMEIYNAGNDSLFWYGTEIDEWDEPKEVELKKEIQEKFPGYDTVLMEVYW